LFCKWNLIPLGEIGAAARRAYARLGGGVQQEGYEQQWGDVRSGLLRPECSQAISLAGAMSSRWYRVRSISCVALKGRRPVSAILKYPTAAACRDLRCRVSRIR